MSTTQQQIRTWVDTHTGITNRTGHVTIKANNHIEIVDTGHAENWAQRGYYLTGTAGLITFIAPYVSTDHAYSSVTSVTSEVATISNGSNPARTMTLAEWQGSSDRHGRLSSVGVDVTQPMTFTIYKDASKVESITFTFDPATKPSNHDTWAEPFFGLDNDGNAGNGGGVEVWYGGWTEAASAPDDWAITNAPVSTVDQQIRNWVNTHIGWGGRTGHVTIKANNVIEIVDTDGGGVWSGHRAYYLAGPDLYHWREPGDRITFIVPYVTTDFAYSSVSSVTSEVGTMTFADWQASTDKHATLLSVGVDVTKAFTFTIYKNASKTESITWTIDPPTKPNDSKINGTNQATYYHAKHETYPTNEGQYQQEHVELRFGGFTQATGGTEYWTLGGGAGSSGNAVPGGQGVIDSIDGTNFDASVATAANADIDGLSNDASGPVSASRSVLALSRFSTLTSPFQDSSFTKSKKRKVLRNLMKQAVDKLTSGRFTMNNKTEFLKFLKVDDDNIDLESKLKNNIEIVKPGTSNLSLNMATTSIYCPFADGESQTFVDSVTGREFTMGMSGTTFTLTIAPTAGGTHGIPTNFTGVADQEGQVYTYQDLENNKETTFVWGSGTASTNDVSGGASGDPYITTLSGVTYKMDDFTGNARLLQGMYQGKLFTLNAETRLLSREEIVDLLHWRHEFLSSTNQKLDSVFASFPAYFSKIFVSHGDRFCVIDSNTLKVIESNYDVKLAHSAELTKGYEWSTVPKACTRVDLAVGELGVAMMSYADKDIRNGFKLFNMDKLSHRSGALEHPIFVRDMKLRSIKSVGPIKQQTPRACKKFTKEEFIENGVSTRRTFQVF